MAGPLLNKTRLPEGRSTTHDGSSKKGIDLPAIPDKITHINSGEATE